MKQISLDSATDAVKQFVRTLPIEGEGIELELDGQIVCTVLPPHALSDAETATLIARGRELVQQSRQRNKGVPARQLEREVHEAVDEVRRRHA